MTTPHEPQQPANLANSISKDNHTSEPLRPYRRRRPSRVQPIVLAIVVHLAILGVGYVIFFDRPSPPMPPTAPSEDVPLSTLTQSQVDVEFAVDDAEQAEEFAKQTDAQAHSLSTQSRFSNGAQPQPMGGLIIPDNQRLPVDSVNQATNQAVVYGQSMQIQAQATGLAMPVEQSSADPSINAHINRQTSDGRALLAAIEEADRENDELRRHLEEAKQLGYQKIERDRNLPRLQPTQDRVVQTTQVPAISSDPVLSSEDVPTGEY